MSSKPERGYSTPELAEDICRITQSLKISKPIIVGHSMAVAIRTTPLDHSVVFALPQDCDLETNLEC